MTTPRYEFFKSEFVLARESKPFVTAADGDMARLGPTASCRVMTEILEKADIQPLPHLAQRRRSLRGKVVIFPTTVFDA